MPKLPTLSEVRCPETGDGLGVRCPARRQSCYKRSRLVIPDPHVDVGGMPPERWVVIGGMPGSLVAAGEYVPESAGCSEMRP